MQEIPEILLDVNRLLGGSGIDWAVCGGFALDLFLGRGTRAHGDLDLSAAEAHRGRIQRWMLERGWQVWEFRGQGMMRPLNADTPSEPGRNLMCVREGCELVTFWPCDVPGMALHEWHSKGIRTLNYMEFLFRGQPEGEAFFSRSPDRAILRRGGIPFLAPEVVLLYKASQPERPVNQGDHAAAFPMMDGEQKAWFLTALETRYPEGHPWLEGGDDHAGAVGRL